MMDVACLITLVLGGLLFLVFLWLGLYPSLRIHKIEYKRFPNTNERNRDWLEMHIEQAKGEALILSGGFDPRVYNPLAQVISQKLHSNPTMRISMLGGPEILTLEGENEIYNLANSIKADDSFEGRLQIGFLDESPLQQYRVIDATHLFVEDPHRLGETHRMVETLENSQFKGWQYKRAFERKMHEAKRADSVVLRPVEDLGISSE